MVSLNVTGLVGYLIAMSVSLGIGVIDVLAGASEAIWINIMMAQLGIGVAMAIFWYVKLSHPSHWRYMRGMGIGFVSISAIELGGRIVTEAQPATLDETLIAFGAVAIPTLVLFIGETRAFTAQQNRREIENVSTQD